MAACPRCGSALFADSSVCPRCGADAMEDSATPTRLFDGVDAPGSGGSAAPGSKAGSGSGGRSSGSSSRSDVRNAYASPGSESFASSHPSDGAHFFPGQRLGDRYRIGALLGKGGMGEIYRADDLKLGQPVALKLLPPALAEDPERLERFYAEVRLARQVSHPNVCRVYDVSEIDGRQVLTMELIDGEDLASLLRRIGRLAPDKAVEIARQICAGLAAAHDRGILHRDLKPANIMLDGRGRARITDFGLAAIAGSVKGLEIQSGTPIYMSPEQLEGREVTVRSDVYSLGVVLYEIFTGKRAYDAKSITALVGQQEWSRPASVSSHVENIDPVIERVILRCLERDPAARPPSPLAVAAGLPGGDPLAAALAAGETPSPEMVAAAGGEGALRFPVAAALFGSFTLGLVLIALSAPWTTLQGRAGIGKPVSVLKEKARDVLAQSGYTTAPGDSAHGYQVNRDYLRWLESQGGGKGSWSDLAAGQKPALGFWYRESPSTFEPNNVAGIVWPNDPPPLSTGMSLVVLDSNGRLSSMTVVPPQVESDKAGAAPSPVASSPPGSDADASPASTSSPTGSGADAALNAVPPRSGSPADWSPLFAAAGLDMAAFQPAEPSWLPLYYADARAAWEGSLPWQEGAKARIEAASYAGKPVYFSVIGPWTQPRRTVPYQQTISERLGQALNVIFFVMLLGGAVVLSRWNIRLGRGDRKGAFRLALFLFVIAMLAWIVRADHVPSFSAEWGQFVRACGIALFDAGLVWLLYIALEPLVRWRWPDSIVGWTRLIGGGYRDPLVGRDLLIGGLFGVVWVFVQRALPFLETLFAGAQSIPRAEGIEGLNGPGWFVAMLLDDQKDGIASAMILLFFLFMGMGMGPKLQKWPALIFTGIAFLMSFLFTPSSSVPARLIISLGNAALMTVLLVRYGALAAIAAHIVRAWAATLGLDLSAWTAPQMVVLWVLLLGLAGYAFWIALGRKSPFSTPRARSA